MTKKQLIEMVRRVIKEEVDFTGEDWMDRSDSTRQHNRLSPDEKKVASILQDKYSGWYYNQPSKTAYDVRKFLMNKEPDLVQDYTKIRIDDIIDYIN